MASTGPYMQAAKYCPVCKSYFASNGANTANISSSEAKTRFSANACHGALEAVDIPNETYCRLLGHLWFRAAGKPPECQLCFATAP